MGLSLDYILKSWTQCFTKDYDYRLDKIESLKTMIAWMKQAQPYYKTNFICSRNQS